MIHRFPIFSCQVQDSPNSYRQDLLRLVSMPRPAAGDPDGIAGNGKIAIAE